MRALRIVLTALFACFAVLAGLVTAVVLAITVGLARAIGRWRPGSRPRAAGAGRSIRRTDDVIEVTATEVPPHELRR